MRKTIYLLLLLATGATACHKKPEIQTLPDPEPVSAFTRTITYPNQPGVVKTAVYEPSYKMEIIGNVSDNKLTLAFLAEPRTGAAGDAIVFELDAVHLQTGLAKTYSLNGQTAASVLYSRYTYSFLHADGSLSGSINDSKMGVRFEGQLTIEKYDAARKIVSGAYTAAINDLISDPTKNGTGPIDPVNQSNVTITGTFSNVKIKTN